MVVVHNEIALFVVGKFCRVGELTEAVFQLCPLRGNEHMVVVIIVLQLCLLVLKDRRHL